ncbi:TetR/AcrR family transcriptional regulator [Nocardia rhamnosiphila]|uniref:TetR/AcrR family transcriptional regulator n=1 Tax=Nocardia rhamnosiphila TaxID=426716 RepID=UPI0034045155
MSLEAGHRRTGVDDQCLDGSTGGATGEFEGVDDVGALGLCVFAEFGLAGARIDRPARRAGISAGLVYSFYEGKGELFDAVFDVIVEMTVATVPLDGDRLPEYAGQLYDAGLAHPEMMRFLCGTSYCAASPPSARRSPSRCARRSRRSNRLSNAEQ